MKPPEEGSIEVSKRGKYMPPSVNTFKGNFCLTGNRVFCSFSYLIFSIPPGLDNLPDTRHVCICQTAGKPERHIYAAHLFQLLFGAEIGRQKPAFPAPRPKFFFCGISLHSKRQHICRLIIALEPSGKYNWIVAVVAECCRSGFICNNLCPAGWAFIKTGMFFKCRFIVFIF